jgi:hypothetical protein
MLFKKVPSSRLIEVTELYMWRMAVEVWKNLQVCGRIVLVPYQEPGASKFAANFFFPPKKDRIHLSLQGEGAWEQENEPRICWGVRIDTMQENL